MLRVRGDTFSTAKDCVQSPNSGANDIYVGCDVLAQEFILEGTWST